MDPIWWWVIAAVVLVLLALLLIPQMRKRKEESRRQQAAEVRQEAQEKSHDLREREAHAMEADAAAQAARAEAQRKLAEAEKLETEGARRGETAAAARTEYEDRVRRADEIDPDVDLDRDGVDDRTERRQGEPSQGDSTYRDTDGDRDEGLRDKFRRKP